MSNDDALSRLTAGLAASEDAANFVLELERPYREMTDQTAEISYEWVRRTRLSNGGGGAMFLDGAPAPKDVLRTVEAIRRALDALEPLLDPEEFESAAVSVVAADVLAALASIYTTDETEGTRL